MSEAYPQGVATVEEDIASLLAFQRAEKAGATPTVQKDASAPKRFEWPRPVNVSAIVALGLSVADMAIRLKHGGHAGRTPEDIDFACAVRKLFEQYVDMPVTEQTVTISDALDALYGKLGP